MAGAGGRHAVLRGITTISKRRTARLAATGIAGDHDRRRARRGAPRSDGDRTTRPWSSRSPAAVRTARRKDETDRTNGASPRYASLALESGVTAVQSMFEGARGQRAVARGVAAMRTGRGATSSFQETAKRSGLQRRRVGGRGEGAASVLGRRKARRARRREGCQKVVNSELSGAAADEGSAGWARTAASVKGQRNGGGSEIANLGNSGQVKR